LQDYSPFNNAWRGVRPNFSERIFPVTDGEQILPPLPEIGVVRKATERLACRQFVGMAL
jgi:hypothetical protein